MSWKVMEGLILVAGRIIVSAPVPVPFLWTLELGPGCGTCVSDLDLGLTIKCFTFQSVKCKVMCVDTEEWRM